MKEEDHIREDMEQEERPEVDREEEKRDAGQSRFRHLLEKLKERARETRKRSRRTLHLLHKRLLERIRKKQMQRAKGRVRHVPKKKKKGNALRDPDWHIDVERIEAEMQSRRSKQKIMKATTRTITSTDYPVKEGPGIRCHRESVIRGAGDGELLAVIRHESTGSRPEIYTLYDPQGRMLAKSTRFGDLIEVFDAREKEINNQSREPATREDPKEAREPEGKNKDRSERLARLNEIETARETAPEQDMER